MSKSINVEIPDELSDVSDVLNEIIKNLLKKKNSKSVEKFRRIIKEVNNRIKSDEIPDTLKLLREIRK
ncbi:MAG: hypothetical protein ACP6IU_11365 [Candidatus Asgardarchaeia archaeon]